MNLKILETRYVIYMRSTCHHAIVSENKFAFQRFLRSEMSNVVSVTIKV